ncbi:peptidoglycan recognition protein [Streptomyces sp. NBC_01167]|uniref:peptidoglycan recognition protein family protein n=1 Tax=Streptomyces sp. NBC_01167 TaxID=2903756 RepID=UPI00386CFA3B|nr:peptidoglycan recognition protein [Streptomyces sp. NBC_01167]
MRGFLASSIGVAASAALVLPLSLSSGAIAAPPRLIQAPDVPGSTQSLPLTAVGPTPSGRSRGPAAEQRLPEQDVRPFSLIGVVWDDVHAELHGSVQVRTRAVGTGAWSAWQDVETHNDDHGADPGTAEGESGKVRGATAPLWVGASDGVEVRVRPETGEPVALPEGMRVELVDPGEDPAASDRAAPGGSSAAGTVLPALSAEETVAQVRAQAQAEVDAGTGAATDAAEVDAAGAAAKPFIGPRPRIITRKGWGASESLREKTFVYTKTVKAAFVHHSATGNSYTCKQAPSVLRSIYRYHVVSSGWRDFGYNFAVDKCGNIYEGRAGGVTRAVLGAHTLGFNTNSMGVAVLGTYSRSTPPAAAVAAIARLTAWKIGLFKGNPKGKVTLTSGGSGKYKKGKKVSFNVISGHRDGFLTECPGARLYSKLGTARSASAKLQGRG